MRAARRPAFATSFAVALLRSRTEAMTGQVLLRPPKLVERRRRTREISEIETAIDAPKR